MTTFVAKQKLLWAMFKDQLRENKEKVRSYRQGKSLTIDSDEVSDKSNSDSDEAIDIPAIKRPADEPPFCPCSCVCLKSRCCKQKKVNPD